MAIFTRPGTRWAVPIGVTAVVVGAAVAVPVIADADSNLPDRTPAQLLGELANSEKHPFAGTLVHTANLGLPELPDMTGQSNGGGERAGADSALGFAQSVLTGSTTARIWYTDSENFRVALQDELTENDVIRNGDDMWFWASKGNTAAHLDLSRAEIPDDAAKAPVPTPSELSEEALANLAKTDVTVRDTVTVAGREAYELVARPQDDGSLIDSVRIAIDGEHFAPLRVKVYSTNSPNTDPAVEVGYTSVTFDEPDASVYDFQPPSGAAIEEIDPAKHDDKMGEFQDIGKNVKILGGGWSSVLMVSDVSIDELTGMAGESAELGDLSEALMSELEPVSGPYGSGFVFKSDLVTALLLDDGRLFAGPVTLDVLEDAAANA